MIDTSLLIGLALIGAGLGLGALAFFFVSRGRDAGPEAKPLDEPPRPEPAAEPVEPMTAPATLPTTTVEGPPAEPAQPEPVAAPPTPDPSSATPSGETLMPETAPDPTPAREPDQRLFPVVTLMRDDTTGQLHLRVGNRTYQKVEELRGSSDQTRVEYAARDLALWLEGRTAVPQPRKEERLAEATPGGGTMVEQINRILERKLSGRPVADRAVRLVEGSGGSVRVYIGVNGFNIDEVPDPAIRAIIREAVAEWEANR